MWALERGLYDAYKRRHARPTAIRTAKARPKIADGVHSPVSVALMVLDHLQHAARTKLS